jgi:hypothetical protein
MYKKATNLKFERLAVMKDRKHFNKTLLVIYRNGTSQIVVISDRKSYKMYIEALKSDENIHSIYNKLD